MSLTKVSCIYSPKYTAFHSLTVRLLIKCFVYGSDCPSDPDSKLCELWIPPRFKRVGEGCWGANLATLDLTLLLSPSRFAFSHLSHPPSLWCRHYFALPTNPGEQFYMFCTLAAWLINKTGRPFEQPQEYDDPNATISNILFELRSFVSILQLWVSVLAIQQQMLAKEVTLSE